MSDYYMSDQSGEDEGYGEYPSSNEDEGDFFGVFQGFAPEMGAIERIGPEIADPWVYKMREQLTGKFSRFKLRPDILNILSSRTIICPPRNISDTGSNLSQKFLNSLNPLATSLAHYIRNDDGSINVQKGLEIKNLLKGDTSCKRDKDCNATDFNNCKNGKCHHSYTDIPSIIRYVDLWNRCYKAISGK